MNDSWIVRAQNIDKRYRAHVVLRKLSLDLRAGELTLLIGSNGAGKSTLMRILAQLDRADSGSISWDLFDKPRSQWPELGYCGHASGLYGDLTPSENLRLQAKLRKTEIDINQAVSQWELESVRNTPVRELSRGFQRRAGLACVFSHNPRHLLLDEPTSGLDSRSVGILLTKLKDWRGSVGKTGAALIVSHDLEHFKPIADRAVLLHGGQIEEESSGSADVNKVVSSYLRFNS